MSNEKAPAPRPQVTVDRAAANAESVAARVRGSLVGVVSASGKGAGWVALGNGLVLTSQDTVGLDGAVEIDLGGSQTVGARVVWVDVAHDLAALLAGDLHTLAPLAIRPDLPRVGEAVYVVSFAAGEPFRVVGTTVTAVDVRVGSLRLFEIAAGGSAPGSAIVDSGGRIVGVAGLDLPRGARRGGAPRHPRPLALPAVTLSKALATFDDTRGGKIESRTPAYACPVCSALFTDALERCIGCGARLPHAWELGGEHAPAEQLLRELFTTLGTSSVGARIGERAWKFEAPPADASRSTLPMTKKGTDVFFSIDPKGTALRGRLSLVKVPHEVPEAFYRFVLTLNDQLAGPFRFDVEGDTVHLSFVELVASLRGAEASALFRELVRLGDHYKKALAEPFDIPD